MMSNSHSVEQILRRRIAEAIVRKEAALLEFSAQLRETNHGVPYEREILIALQTLESVRQQSDHATIHERWDNLAAQVEASPTNWRWWITPSSKYECHRRLGKTWLAWFVYGRPTGTVSLCGR
jgi:hypothetical protein